MITLMVYKNNGLTSSVLSGSSRSVLRKLTNTTKAVDERISGVKYSVLSFMFWRILFNTYHFDKPDLFIK